MDNQDETLHGLEDEYMDDLIRLAVKRERMQEAEDILRLSREPVSPEEESRLDRIWSQALTRMDEIESRKKKAGRVRTMRSAIINFSRIAACLAVLIVIGAGFAVATNSTFRSAVYRLFITEDAANNVVYMNFKPDMNASFDVPEGWTGLYYPSGITPEFEVTFTNDDPARIELEAADGRGIEFQDLSPDSVGAFNKDSDFEITIYGRKAWISEKITDDYVKYVISWGTDDRWLTLTTYDMTREEAIALAESVRRINPEN